MKQRTKTLIKITIFIIAIIVLIILFHVRYDVYRLSPNVCTVVLDTSPKEFMNDQGEGTILDGGYTYAKIDTKGNLVLILTKEESDAWKNSDFGIQILAKLWEGERDIGIQISFLPKSYFVLCITHILTNTHNFREDQTHPPCPIR